MKIGVIVGSVRDGQAGASVGEWVLRHAQAKGGAEFELVSLKDFDLPVFSSATLPAMAEKSYDDAKVQAWLQRGDAGLRFTLAMLNELATQKTLDYPTVSVAVQRLAQLAARG